MLFNAAIDAEQVHYVYSLAYRSKRAGPPVPRLPGTPDASRLPSSLVGFWPLDGSGEDLGSHGLVGSDPAPLWVGGRFGLALTFGDGNGFVVPDMGGAMAGITSGATMLAYVRPTQYEACGDRGIIMNKEGTTPSIFSPDPCHFSDQETLLTEQVCSNTASSRTPVQCKPPCRPAGAGGATSASAYMTGRLLPSRSTAQTRCIGELNRRVLWFLVCD